MKRLFSASILILLLLFSCKSTEEAVITATPENSGEWLTLLESEESIENRYNLLYSLYSEGAYQRVIEEADRALLLYPDYTRILKIKAAAERETGDTSAYAATLALVLEREPYDESLRDMYTDALLENGEKEKALDFSRDTILIFPKNEKAISVLSETSAFYSYLKETSQSQV